MVYSNILLRSETRKFDWGSIDQISLGEQGRGRKLLAITTPSATTISIKENSGLSMALTKSGKPRVNATEDGNVYMLISTEGAYIRGAQGTVSTINMEDVEVLGSGNGAYGEAGRVGNWDVFALKIVGNDVWIRVKKTRHDPEFYHVINGKIVHFETFDNVKDWADETNAEISFGPKFEDGWTRIKTN